MLISLLLAMLGSAQADDSAEVMNHYVTMAIQGDLAEAQTLFVEAKLEERSPGAALRESYNERFTNQQAASSGDLVDEIVFAYQEYWKTALLDTLGRVVYEQELDLKLTGLLSDQGDMEKSEPAVSTSLAMALENEGLFHFASQDPPLRDLLIWGTQESKAYSVQLTDRQLDLTVHFLDAFQLLGWKEYASLGLTTTTGWVDEGELYCIAWAYNPESENFEVSYLKHEARHLLDLERYPHMESTELEYRSKLTELAFADQSLRRVLEDFAEKSAPNPGSPHAMANWRVIRDVYWKLFGEEMVEGFDDWYQLKTEIVNQAARELLALNTEEHEKTLIH